MGKIVLIAANGGAFTLSNVLWVPSIQKNLLSVSAIARGGLMVKFLDDRCTVHDISDGDTIVAYGTLCHGLYRLDHYESALHDALLTTTPSQLANAELWHACFGHLNFRSLLRLHSHEMVSEMPHVHTPTRHVCEGCILGKMHRTPIPKDGTVRAVRRLQLIHSDVCGSMRTPSIGGYLYFVTFIDDFSRFMWLYPLKEKSEVFTKFRHFITQTENYASEKLGTLRTDQGGNTCQRNFMHILQKEASSISVPLHTPPSKMG